MTKFCFTFACCLFATSLLAADFTLKPTAQVVGPIVRLGDVCHIETGDAQEQAKLALLELGPAPSAGGAKYWRQREVQDRLQLLGFSLVEHRFGGSPLTTIGIATAAAKTAPVTRNTVQRRSIDDAVVGAVQRKLEGTGEAWTVLAKIEEEQYAKLPAGAHLINVIGEMQAIAGEQLILVETLGQKPQRLQLTVELQPAPLMVATVRNVPRGNVITANDVELRPQPGAVGGAVQTTFLTKIEDVVGREAAQSFVSNQPVTAKLLRNPTLVQRGDVVDVTVHAGGIKVATKARAKIEGGQGDIVQIELLHNKQAMVARVSGLQTVEILGSAER
jgi:flagella basal body P-ring formation protein FlgA